MKKSNIILLSLITLFFSASTLFSKENALEAQNKKQRILIVYYSWGGNTQSIAQQIQKTTGGDIFEIETVKPYSRDYHTCTQEAKIDLQKQARPALKKDKVDMTKYDIVLLGYPNWWSSIPMPVASFLEKNNFSGKRVIPFCSHGGGGLAKTVSAVKALLPSANIGEALSVRSSGGSSLQGDIDGWLRKNGLSGK